MERKRCFLERFEWQTTPWQDQVPQRSYLSLITDIFCSIPGLMEDVDLLELNWSEEAQAPPNEAALKRKLLSRVEGLADLLRRWHAENSSSCWEEQPDPHCALFWDEDYPFQTILRYKNETRAIEILNFNTVWLLLYSLCHEMRLSDVMISTSTNLFEYETRANPLLEPNQGGAYSHAIEICRSVDYLAADLDGYRSALQLVFPLSLAYSYLAEYPNTQSWVRRVLEYISDSGGFRIASHMPYMLSQAPGNEDSSVQLRVNTTE